jgi:hypothetical protein
MGRYDTGLLPRDVVRDLLGITRALYATRKAAGAGPEELAKLEGAGKEFVMALELSGKTEPDTNGHRAAWSKADRGTAALLDLLVCCDDSLAKLVLAWAERLKRTG